MPNPLPHWHPDADFAHVSFFIRRMNTSGSIKPDKVPQAVLPGMGFIYLTGGEILVEADSRPYLCAAGRRNCWALPRTLSSTSPQPSDWKTSPISPAFSGGTLG